MAVAYQTSTKVSWSSGDGTIAVPPGTVDGDLLLLFVGGDLGASENHTYTVTGWNELLTLTRSHATNAGVDLKVFYRIASSEPASYVIDIDSDNLSGAVMVRIDGHDGSDPFDASSITGFDDGTEAKISSINTTVANTLAIGIVSWDQSKTQTTIPADWTEAQHVDVSGFDLSVIYRAYAATGATGVAQYDLSSAAPYVSGIVIVQPPQGAVSISMDMWHPKINQPYPEKTEVVEY
jgi:hypothetical protein